MAPRPHECRQPDCAWVDDDPDAWSRDYLVSFPDWALADFGRFMEVLDLLVAGMRREAVSKFGGINGARLQQWVREHIEAGCEVGCTRRQAVLDAQDPDRRERRRIAKQAVAVTLKNFGGPRVRRVFETDAYTCRFHGQPLVAAEVFRALARDPDFGPLGDLEAYTRRRNIEYWHGLAAAFLPSHDHVLPLNWGGTNDPANLVTACYTCQFGRMNARLEDVLVSDPRRVDRRVKGWNGRADSLVALADGSP